MVAYTNKANFLLRSLFTTKQIIVKLDDATKKVGLRGNEQKSKIMAQIRKPMLVRQNTTNKQKN